MMYSAKLTAAAALLSMSFIANAAPGIDSIANETPSTRLKAQKPSPDSGGI